MSNNGNIYRPHPKDGEDHVFSLFTTGGGGGGGGLPPVRFPVPSPDSGPRSFLGVPQSLVPCPFWGGGTPVSVPMSYPGGGVPQSCHRACWGSTSRTGVPPSQDWGINPPPSGMTGIPPARTGVPPPSNLGQVMPRAVRLVRFPAGGLSRLME